jgi:hypothetical protein
MADLPVDVIDAGGRTAHEIGIRQIVEVGHADNLPRSDGALQGVVCIHVVARWEEAE